VTGIFFAPPPLSALETFISPGMKSWAFGDMFEDWTITLLAPLPVTPFVPKYDLNNEGLLPKATVLFPPGIFPPLA
jgi:hypothetical protein